MMPDARKVAPTQTFREVEAMNCIKYTLMTILVISSILNKDVNTLKIVANSMDHIISRLTRCFRFERVSLLTFASASSNLTRKIYKLSVNGGPDSTVLQY